jgi:hypothetical protein
MANPTAKIATPIAEKSAMNDIDTLPDDLMIELDSVWR